MFNSFHYHCAAVMSASTPGRHPLRGNGAMRVFLCLRDHEGEGKDAALSVDDEDKTTVKETKAKDGRNKSFSCDEAFPPTASSGDIFHTAVRPLLLHALDGATCTFFLYGQKGVGKSFLINGVTNTSPSATGNAGGVSTDENEQGLIGRSIDQLYEFVGKRPDSYAIKASYFEVRTDDEIVDLLDPTPPPEIKYRIRGSEETLYNDRCVHIEGLTQTTVANKKELMGIYEKGLANRKIMQSLDGGIEHQSSQSHTIFQICIQYSVEGGGEGSGVLLGSAGTVTTGYLNMVDLMGSCEKCADTGAVSTSSSPNNGLDALHKVIEKLANSSSTSPSRNELRFGSSSPSIPTKKHIPFRDSILTRILKPSFQCHSLVVTCIMCMISSQEKNIEDSIRVLKFSQVCKHLKLPQIENFEYEIILETIKFEIGESNS